MIIQIDAGFAVSLLERENFSDFRVSVAADVSSFKQLQEILAASAYIQDDDAVWVSAARVEEFSGMAESQRWKDSFKRMIEYARRQGWWDDDHKRIRARIVRM